MDFTIIGAGNMGRGIAIRLLSGKNSVVIMDRDNAGTQKLTEELRSAAKGNANISAAPMGSPINSEAVILAVYYPSVPTILSQYSNQLAGKIIVDITNPLNATFDDLATPPGSSAAEEIAKQVPASAKVIKAFNTTFAGTLVSGQVAGQSLDVFIAGDDPQAKEHLSEALKRARQSEGIGLLHITLQQTLGTNWASAVKILP